MGSSNRNAIEVISWKAKQMGTTYGDLCAHMTSADLEVFTKEYTIFMEAKKNRLEKEAKARQVQRKKAASASKSEESAPYDFVLEATT